METNELKVEFECWKTGPLPTLFRLIGVDQEEKADEHRAVFHKICKRTNYKYNKIFKKVKEKLTSKTKQCIVQKMSDPKKQLSEDPLADLRRENPQLMERLDHLLQGQDHTRELVLLVEVLVKSVLEKMEKDERIIRRSLKRVENLSSNSLEAIQKALPDQVWESREFVEQAMIVRPYISLKLFILAHEHHASDEGLLKRAIRNMEPEEDNFRLLFNYGDNRFRSDEAIASMCYDQIDSSPVDNKWIDIYQFFSEDLRSNKEIIRRTPSSHLLKSLPDRIKNDKEKLRRVMSMEEHIVELFGNPKLSASFLQETPENVSLVSGYCCSPGASIEHVPDWFLDNRKEIIFCITYGRAQFFQELPETFHDDKELVLAAIKGSAENFRHLKGPLREDREIVLEAVKGDKNNFELLEGLRNDPEILKVAKEKYLEGKVYSDSKFPTELHDDEEVGIRYYQAQDYWSSNSIIRWGKWLLTKEKRQEKKTVLYKTTIQGIERQIREGKIKEVDDLPGILRTHISLRFKLWWKNRTQK